MLKNKIKIVNIDKVHFVNQHVIELSKKYDLNLHNEKPQNKEDLERRIKNANVLLVNNFKVDKDTLDLCNQVRLLCIFGTGYDFVDIKYAASKNIKVCNVPSYSTESVVEHIIYLMLGAIRLSSLAERDLRAGLWYPHKYCGRELQGKKLGIIGYGKIGKRLKQVVLHGFGMEVSYINSKSTKKEMHSLLRTSDVISLCVPLNERTRGMISRPEFFIMKKNAILINVSRGCVVDEGALVSALNIGRISGGGFDVFCNEPIGKDSALLKCDRLVLTPHMAFKTEESSYRLSLLVSQNIISFLNNKPINIVN